jgi:hypothetical protein
MKGVQTVRKFGKEKDEHQVVIFLAVWRILGAFLWFHRPLSLSLFFPDGLEDLTRLPFWTGV